MGLLEIGLCKRHLTSRIHSENVKMLFNQKHGVTVKCLFNEKASDQDARLEHSKRERTNEEQIRILMDNVLLAIKMNASMLSVQMIHDHLAKYITLPDSWRSKNYALSLWTLSVM